MRAFILYDRSKRVPYAMIALYMSTVAVSFIDMMFQGSQVQFGELCLVSYAPKSVVAGWIAPVVFEATLFCLVIYKFVFNIKAVPELKRQPNLYVFVRDAVWAFSLIRDDVLTVMSYSVFPAGLRAPGSIYFWDISICSFAGSHVLLNLRPVGSNARDPCSFSSSSELCDDDLDFGHADGLEIESDCTELDDEDDA